MKTIIIQFLLEIFLSFANIMKKRNIASINVLYISLYKGFFNVPFSVIIMGPNIFNIQQLLYNFEKTFS